MAVVAGSVPPGRMTSPTSSAMAAVRMVSPLATPLSQVLRWASVPNWAIGHGAVDHRLDDGHVGRGATGRLDHEAGGDEVEARAADVLAQADAEQAGVGQLTPEVAVDRTLRARRRLDRLERLVGGALGEDLPGQLADGFLLFAVGEVHWRLLVPSGSAQRARHAEPEHGDEVPLDLVGPAAEGEDDHGAGVHLEASGDHRGR